MPILACSCMDLKCLLHVCATVKIQFANTLNHTHSPLGRYASLRIRPPPPLFENSGSVPDIYI